MGSAVCGPLRVARCVWSDEVGPSHYRTSIATFHPSKRSRSSDPVNRPDVQTNQVIRLNTDRSTVMDAFEENRLTYLLNNCTYSSICGDYCRFYDVDAPHGGSFTVPAVPIGSKYTSTQTIYICHNYTNCFAVFKRSKSSKRI